MTEKNEKNEKQAEREAITHELKCDHGPFQDILSGRKKAEVRRDDRDFRVGDRLNLLETVNTAEQMRAGAPLEYTGGQDMKVVTHVQRGYGLPDGVLVLSFDDAPAGDFCAALAQQPQGEAVASQSAEPVALTDAKTLALGAMVDAMRWWGAQEDGIPAECKKAFDSAMLALGWSYSHPQDLKVLAAPPAATRAHGLTSQRVEEIAKAYFHQDGTELGDMKTAIRVSVREALAQSAPRADHVGDGAEMVVRKCTRCEYIGHCDCEPAAPSASAQQAEPVALSAVGQSEAFAQWFDSDDGLNYRDCWNAACAWQRGNHQMIAAAPVDKAEISEDERLREMVRASVALDNHSEADVCRAYARQVLSDAEAIKLGMSDQFCSGYKNAIQEIRSRLALDGWYDAAHIAAPAPSASPAAHTGDEAGANDRGPADTYLCKAWGETDLPAAAIVSGLDGVRSFLISEWLGSADSCQDDGTNSLDEAMSDMQEQWAREGEAWEWSIEFEIGGVSVQKVGSAAQPPAAAAPQSAAQDARDGGAA